MPSYRACCAGIMQLNAWICAKQSHNAQTGLGDIHGLLDRKNAGGAHLLWMWRASLPALQIAQDSRDGGGRGMVFAKKRETTLSGASVGKEATTKNITWEPRRAQRNHIMPKILHDPSTSECSQT